MEIVKEFLKNNFNENTKYLDFKKQHSHLNEDYNYLSDVVAEIQIFLVTESLSIEEKNQFIKDNTNIDFKKYNISPLNWIINICVELRYNLLISYKNN